MQSTTSPTRNKQNIVTDFSNPYKGQKHYGPLNASIDFLTISTDAPDAELVQLIRKIASQSSSTKPYKTKAFAYNRVLKCVYNYSSSSYKIFIIRANKAFLPKVLIKILQPDRELLLKDELISMNCFITIIKLVMSSSHSIFIRIIRPVFIISSKGTYI